MYASSLRPGSITECMHVKWYAPLDQLFWRNSGEFIHKTIPKYAMDFFFIPNALFFPFINK